MGAKKGRSDLNNQVQSNLPTNNSKAITATSHRDVLDSVSKSKFNLIDDDLNSIEFDNTGTNLNSDKSGDALKEVNDKMSNSLLVMAKGTVSIGDIGTSGSANVTGDFGSATKIAIDISTEIAVTFTDPLTNSNYIPIISYKVSATNGNQAFQASAFITKSTTGFTFKISERTAEAQNIIANILIVAF